MSPAQPPTTKLNKLTCCGCTVVGCEFGQEPSGESCMHIVQWPEADASCRMRAANCKTKLRRSQEGRGGTLIDM